MSKSNINSWESGAVPRNSTVKKIADFFGVTEAALLSNQTNNDDAKLEIVINTLLAKSTIKDSAVIDKVKSAISLPHDKQAELLKIIAKEVVRLNEESKRKEELEIIEKIKSLPTKSRKAIKDMLDDI
jgi:transcriptional regulator with XRE-family HTH domain